MQRVLLIASFEATSITRKFISLLLETNQIVGKPSTVLAPVLPVYAFHWHLADDVQLTAKCYTGVCFATA